MNVQVIATPDGDIVRVSGALPGSVHDTKAAWIWQIVRELARCGLMVLADKGYHGVDGLLTPYRGAASPNRRKPPTARTRGCEAPANARTPSSRAGKCCINCGAARTRPGH